MFEEIQLDENKLLVFIFKDIVPKLMYLTTSIAGGDCSIFPYEGNHYLSRSIDSFSKTPADTDFNRRNTEICPERSEIAKGESGTVSLVCFFSLSFSVF